MSVKELIPYTYIRDAVVKTRFLGEIFFPIGDISCDITRFRLRLEYLNSVDMLLDICNRFTVCYFMQGSHCFPFWGSGCQDTGSRYEELRAHTAAVPGLISNELEESDKNCAEKLNCSLTHH